MKVAVLPKLICTFSAIPVKILAVVFAENDRLILRFLRKYRRLRIIKTVLKKSKKVGRVLPLSNIKTNCKATVIKAAWCGHKDRRVDRGSRTKGMDKKSLHI